MHGGHACCFHRLRLAHSNVFLIAVNEQTAVVRIHGCLTVICDFEVMLATPFELEHHAEKAWGLVSQLQLITSTARLIQFHVWGKNLEKTFSKNFRTCLFLHFTVVKLVR